MHKKQSKWLKDIFMILITALITAVLTIFTTTYIQTRSKPNLQLDYAWCISVTEQVPGEEAEIVSFLVDVKTVSVISGNAVRIKVMSPKNYKFTPGAHTYIGKIIVTNEGGSTASNVKIGIGYTYPVEFQFTVSPNVHAEISSPLQPNIAEANIAFPLKREVIIDYLPPNTKAFITVSWTLLPSIKDALGDSPDPQNSYFPDIFYLSSYEALGLIRNFISYNKACEIEHELFDYSQQHSWSPIIVDSGMVLNIEPITPKDKIQIDFQLDGLKSKNPSTTHIGNQ